MARDRIKWVIDVDSKTGVVSLRKFDNAQDKITKNMKTQKNAATSLGSAYKKMFATMSVAAAAWGAMRIGQDILAVGANFEHSMNVVRGVMRATDAEFIELTAIAKKMGETTEKSASEAADALKFLGMAGFNASKAMAVLPGVIDLSTAGNIDLGRAADITTNALTAMGLATSEIGRVNDSFIATITRSNTNMDMMAESFVYAAPVAKAYGYEIEDLSALLGILGNAGIQGSMAGTQLAFSMQKVDSVFKKLGIDGSGKNLIDALEAINKAGWSNNEIMKTFGMRGGRAVLVLKDMISEYKVLQREVRGAKDEHKELAEIMRSDTLGAWKEFKSVVESIKIDIFDGKKGEVKESLKELTKYLRENKTELLETAAAVTTLVIAIAKLAAVTTKYTIDPILKTTSGLANISKVLGMVSGGTLDMGDVARALANPEYESNNAVFKALLKKGEAILSGRPSFGVSGSFTAPDIVPEPGTKPPPAGIVVPPPENVPDPVTLPVNIDFKGMSEASEKAEAIKKIVDDIGLIMTTGFASRKDEDFQPDIDYGELKQEIDPFSGAIPPEEIAAIDRGIAETKIGIAKGLRDQMAELSMSEYEFKKYLLDQEVTDMMLYAEGDSVLQDQIAEYRKLKSKEAADAQKQQNLEGLQQVLSGTAGVFQQIAQIGGKHSKKMFRIYQATAIAEALIAAHGAAATTLKTGGFWAIPLAAIAYGAAIAQMAAIASAKPPSFDTGGVTTKEGIYHAGNITEAHVPMPGGNIPVKFMGGPQSSGSNVTFQMNNPVFQDLETRNQTIAQMAAMINRAQTPGIVLETLAKDYDDGGISRDLMRSGY